MSDSSVIIVDLDVRGEREITRLADALKRWLHQQELTADIDTGRQVFTPDANCGTIAVCPRCSNKVSAWVDIANDTLTAWVEYRGEDGVACPHCAHTSRVSEWTWRDGEPWALGELAITFHNPEHSITESFLPRLQKQLDGHELKVIHSHL